MRRPMFTISNPLAPALSPFGGERELCPFGAGIKRRPSIEKADLIGLRGGLRPSPLVSPAFTGRAANKIPLKLAPVGGVF